MYAKDNCTVGTTYGMLTVIERDYEEEDVRVSSGKQRRAYYRCSCGCGSTKTVLGSQLYKGITKSCGCMKKSQNVGRKVSDKTGMIIGDYEVVMLDNSEVRHTGMHAKWLCRCVHCGRERLIRGSEVEQRKNLCSCMASGRVSSSSDNLTGMVFGHLTVLRVDNNAKRGSGLHTKWVCKCDLCGGTESVNSSALSSGEKVRCKNCTPKSLGEARIAEILTENGIEFSTEYVDRRCRNSKTGGFFRFDFSVKSNDGMYLIEFDGAQHFRPVLLWDNNCSYEDRVMMDNLKTEFCVDNGIPLIRIPYTRLKKLCIEDLLLESSEYVVRR